MKRSTYALAVSSGILSALIWHNQCVAQIALPRFDLIGGEFEPVKSILHVASGDILPQSIRLEIEGKKLVAMVCEYSKRDVSYSLIRSNLQATLKHPPKVSGPITTAWRLEERRCAVMITHDEKTGTLQLIVRTIEKPSKKEESKE